MAEIANAHDLDAASRLRNHYVVRAGVAVAWVIAAVTVGAADPILGGVLLVLYPAWDALANALDARSSGGFRANASQTANLVISLLATVTMALATAWGVHATIIVFGLWAVPAGVFQLVTGLRRWRTYGAQWAMVLSGAQSVLAGAFFVALAQGVVSPPGGAALSIASLAGYAGFGAFYFLVSALWLTFRKRPGV